jgi:predicted MFS family arabinose efflux permease
VAQDGRRPSGGLGREVAGAAARLLTGALGGVERARVIVLLAAVLALSSADTSTVGAAAAPLRKSLHISNTDVGLLVTATSLIAAAASLPFGVLADRVRRTRVLGATITLWAAAMIWSATASSFGELLLTRLLLGAVTASAGPLVASLVGDFFPASERSRIYGYILAGELAGAGVGFGVTGGIAALSWQAAFVVLALPAFVLAWLVFRLPEPERGGSSALIAPDAPGAVDRPGRDDADAHELARRQGVAPDAGLVLEEDPRRMSLLAATRYVLGVRTNVVLILASACGYYFLAGVQTFGVEFMTRQYWIRQALAGLPLLVIGAGAIVGVLAGGAAGDLLLRHGYLNGRILVSAFSATAATVLFVPPIVTHSALTAVPYLVFAALFLSAQNPPVDAARLDIVVPALWGRAEAVRTVLRTGAQALAPLLFGAVSDYVFGGGGSGLRWTFLVMLAPLAGSAVFLYRGLATYPGDVAAAAASARRGSPRAAL